MPSKKLTLMCALDQAIVCRLNIMMLFTECKLLLMQLYVSLPNQSRKGGYVKQMRLCPCWQACSGGCRHRGTEERGSGRGIQGEKGSKGEGRGTGGREHVKDGEGWEFYHPCI